ncbi:unnamed protein product [Lepeophtheirus salmonis]|uniref:(salmon louse) hypothetical protein n=2 Tax=Lepeophtheirus salmonis TaxID=72036 RepID=A0A7R8H7Y8_LEPSM|nr:larval cuticle protein 65Ag1-like [Lepeophtheirus salmonis]CAB4062873.1 unnamed protein product [Lepeophtheirus salmonis]CAF2912846.1 unnamed protein product [Lepeophtheirus salmonis]
MISFISASFLASCLLLTLSAAAPQNTRPHIAILNSQFNAPGTLDTIGQFDYSFSTANGIKQEAVGQSKLVGNEEIVTMKGYYEFVADDGQTYGVNWYADENGYHPSAPHLPSNLIG